MTEFIKEINSTGTKMFRINQRSGETVLRIRIYMDPFPLGLPDLFHEVYLDTDRGKQNHAQLTIRINQNHKNIMYKKNTLLLIAHLNNKSS